MIKIAICDNDKDICSLLQKLLFQIQEIYQEEYEYAVYDQSSAFSEKLKENRKLHGGEARGNVTGYDLIFLDIEMPKISGIELAKYIRDEIHDDDVMIVFISSYTAYALQLFEVHPLDFLIKPLNLEKLKHLFQKAYRIMGTGDEYFSFRYNREQTRIRISNIIYIESDARKIILHAMDGEHYFYGKISDLLEDQRFRGFIQIHKSLIINYKNIVRVKSGGVDMNNGITLPISQQNRKHVMQKFLEMESN